MSRGFDPTIYVACPSAPHNHWWDRFYQALPTEVSNAFRLYVLVVCSRKFTPCPITVHSLRDTPWRSWADHRVNVDTTSGNSFQSNPGWKPFIGLWHITFEEDICHASQPLDTRPGATRVQLYPLQATLMPQHCRLKYITLQQTLSRSYKLFE
jgi:hypothetical protein